MKRLFLSTLQFAEIAQNYLSAETVSMALVNSSCVAFFNTKRRAKIAIRKHDFNLSLKREPAAEGGRSIGLIGYLSVYKTILFHRERSLTQGTG